MSTALVGVAAQAILWLAVFVLVAGGAFIVSHLALADSADDAEEDR